MAPPRVQEVRQAVEEVRYGEEKKRTREHIIADFSLVHVQYFIGNAGSTSEATTKDTGYDLTVNTFDRDGLIEAGAILIQLKASETLTTHSDGKKFIFDLDVRDYNPWVREPNPVFLILDEAASRGAYSLYFQLYVKSADARKPKTGARGIRVKIPKFNRVRTDFFIHAHRLKQQTLTRLLGADLHG